MNLARMKNIRFVAMLCAGTAMVCSPESLLAAEAQADPAVDADAETSNDIVVTATKRASSVQDVPFSINAQTGEAIERANVQSLEELSRNITGLSIQNLGPGQSQISIRGISGGQITRDQPGVKEQVGVYLDESVISLSLFTPDIDLFDLNRVETLRGPQGTLFGSGSVGGTIRYITNQPRTDRLEGQVEAGLTAIDGGNVGGSVKGAVNLPLTPDLAVRAVGYFTRYAGFIDAVFPGGVTKKNVNDGYRAGGRIGFDWKPTDALSITPRLLYQKIDVNGFNRRDIFNIYGSQYTSPQVNLDGNQQVLLRDENFSDKFLLADNTMTLDLGAVELAAITSYTDRDILVLRDISTLVGSVTIDQGLPAAAALIPASLFDRTKVRQFTQEVRLSSQNDGPFEWVIGGFYARTKRAYSQNAFVPGYDAFVDARFGAGTSAAVANGVAGVDNPLSLNLPSTLRQYSVFAEGNYTIGDALHLTAGARYFDYSDSNLYQAGGLFSTAGNVRQKTKSNGVAPRFIIAYDVTSDIKVNLQASKGFRLGGVNNPLKVGICSPQDAATFGPFQSYGDETLWNFEGGVKSKLGPVRLNVAAFYNSIRNLQVTLDAGSCSQRFIFNVPKAHSAGVEFELSATPTEGLDINLSGTFADAKFDSTAVSGSGAVLSGIRKGNRLPTAPRFQLSGSGTYSFPIDAGETEAFVTTSYQYVGSRYTQPADQEGNPVTFASRLALLGATGTGTTVLDLRLPDYSLVNLGLGINFADDLQISAYVNNVADKQARLAFDRERGGRARLAFQVNQPRTFGMTVRKGF